MKTTQQQAKQILTSVKSLRNELNKWLDSLEKNTTRLVDSVLTKIEKQLDYELQTCHALTNQMAQLSYIITTKRAINGVVAFCK